MLRLTWEHGNQIGLPRYIYLLAKARLDIPWHHRKPIINSIDMQSHRHVTIWAPRTVSSIVNTLWVADVPFLGGGGKLQPSRETALRQWWPVLGWGRMERWRKRGVFIEVGKMKGECLLTCLSRVCLGTESPAGQVWLPGPRGGRGEHSEGSAL